MLVWYSFKIRSKLKNNGKHFLSHFNVSNHVVLLVKVCGMRVGGPFNHDD